MVSFYGLNVTVDPDPLCYFRQFLDDSVIERIVVETNRYAEQTDSSHTKRRSITIGMHGRHAGVPRVKSENILR